MKINKLVINGSKIAGYQIKQLRMVSVNVVVKAGAWYETDGNCGYFHLLEHLMMTGTIKFKSRQEISIYKEKYGIGCGASTGYKEMTFWFNFPDIYLKEGFELIDQIVFKSAVNFNNIANELAIIEQEYNDSWSSPYKKFSSKIGCYLGGEKCNFNNEILGEPVDLRKVKREELKKLYEKHFVPNNIFWGISGNFKTVEVEAILCKIIPKVETEVGRITSEIEAKNYSPSYGELEFKSKIEQPEVRLIWQLPLIKKLSLEKRYGLNKFNYLLGAGTNSALFMRIRQELGLTYGIESHFWHWPSCSFLEISFSTEKGKIDATVAEAKKILNDLIVNKVSQEKLDRVGNFMDLSTIMSYNSTGEIASMLAWSLNDSGKVMTPKEIIRIAHKVNFEETQRWLLEHMSEAKMLTAMMLPTT